MDSEKNQNFDVKISEHIESAVNHFFSHKKLSLEFQFVSNFEERIAN